MQKNAQIEPGKMDEILRTHLIDAEALRADDFGKLFGSRSRALLGRIERAMGKAALGEASEPEPQEAVEAGAA